MRHWLLKSEADCFSINDLANLPKQITSWDGVRNYQARNFMRDDMSIGDLAFFYHSGKNPEIVGIVEIVSKPYPDHTAQNPQGEHFDPAASPDNPRWFMVDVQLRDIFKQPISRTILRNMPELSGMELLKIGSRLSIQPVEAVHFERIMSLTK